MYKRRLISIYMAFAVLLTGCGGAGGGMRDPGELPDMLYAVPSDALAVCCVSESGAALGRLDSTDRLRSLDL